MLDTIVVHQGEAVDIGLPGDGASFFWGRLLGAVRQRGQKGGKKGRSHEIWLFSHLWVLRRAAPNRTARSDQPTLRARFSQKGLRSSFLRILPTPESGIAVRNSTLRGHL
ncbi:hypothetical protein FQZ97_748020 [compost metagenome]